MRYLSSLATEYVAYKIAATDYTGTPLNIATDTVKLAFVAPGANPATGDWRQATWMSTGVAAVLVGPDNGGVALAAGTYDVWIWVQDNPEVPKRKVDALRIT